MTAPASPLTTDSVLVNGVDTRALMVTVNAIKDDPGLGACRFRARNTWLSGNHNRSVVTGFFGARQDIAHAQAFTMISMLPQHRLPLCLDCAPGMY